MPSPVIDQAAAIKNDMHLSSLKIKVLKMPVKIIDPSEVPHRAGRRRVSFWKVHPGLFKIAGKYL